MSLHEILEVIRSSARAKIEEIETRAYAQAGEIVANARLEAETVKEQACAATIEPGYRERARILHRARLAALHILGDEREGLVDSAMEQAHGRLANLRSASIYPEVLRKLLIEALEGLQKIGRLEADERDRPILENLINEMGLDLPVRYSLKCWGGLIAESEDGRLVVINTLNARFERATPYLRRSLAAMFEEGQAESTFEETLERKRVL